MMRINNALNKAMVTLKMKSRIINFLELICSIRVNKVRGQEANNQITICQLNLLKVLKRMKLKIIYNSLIFMSKIYQINSIMSQLTVKILYSKVIVFKLIFKIYNKT